MEGLGGLALGMAVAAWDLRAGLWLLAAMLVVSAAVAASIPVAPASSRAQLDLRALAQVLRHKSTWIVGGFAALVLCADHMTGALAYEFLVNRLHWSTQAISQELPPAVLVGSLTGFAAAAWIADRLGHRKTALVGSLGLGALWIAFGLAEPAWATRGFVLAFVGLQGVATGLLYTGLHAWLMDRVDPRVRATHFAAFTALLNLPRAIMPTAAPGVLARLGWSGVFIAAGGFQLLAGAVLAGGAADDRPHGAG
jgi:MFS family permease